MQDWQTIAAEVAASAGMISIVMHSFGFDEKKWGKVLLAVIPDFVGAFKHAIAAAEEPDPPAK